MNVFEYILISLIAVGILVGLTLLIIHLTNKKNGGGQGGGGQGGGGQGGGGHGGGGQGGGGQGGGGQGGGGQGGGGHGGGGQGGGGQGGGGQGGGGPVTFTIGNIGKTGWVGYIAPGFNPGLNFPTGELSTGKNNFKIYNYTPSVKITSIVYNSNTKYCESSSTAGLAMGCLTIGFNGTQKDQKDVPLPDVVNMFAGAGSQQDKYKFTFAINGVTQPVFAAADDAGYASNLLSFPWVQQDVDSGHKKLPDLKAHDKFTVSITQSS